MSKLIAVFIRELIMGLFNCGIIQRQMTDQSVDDNNKV
jgi:hypothetical protein